MIAQEDLIDFAFGLLAGDATLTAAAPGGVHRDVAPGTVTAYPLITLGIQANTDRNTSDGRRIFESVLLRVSAHDDRADYSRIRTAANRADELLQGAKGNQGDAYIVKLRREQVLPLPPEIRDGRTYPQLVQLYRSEVD